MASLSLRKGEGSLVDGGQGNDDKENERGFLSPLHCLFLPSLWG